MKSWGAHASRRSSRRNPGGHRVYQEIGGRKVLKRVGAVFHNGLLEPRCQVAYRAINIKDTVRLGPGTLSALMDGIVVEMIKLELTH